MDFILFHRVWPDPALLLAALGLVWFGLLYLLRLTYVQGDHSWPTSSSAPQFIHISPLDYGKALLAWIDNYQRTYAIAPGLYYTGEKYDQTMPLLVTANYQLTVFLLLHRCWGLNVRLLVVDSDAINVWCAAGKGRFSNQRIIEQLERYERNILAAPGKRIQMILPKFGFPGVDYRELFHHHYRLRPIIGPFYAKDLPKYLEKPPLKDCRNDRVRFGLQSRIFTLLPGFFQSIAYYLPALLVMLVLETMLTHKVALWLLLFPLLVAFLYPLLFPIIPGVRFAVKGIWLGGVLSVVFCVGWILDMLSIGSALTGTLFTLASAIFFGLSYTGNSAVSNYSSVRKETALFLPWCGALMLLALAGFIYIEVVL